MNILGVSEGFHDAGVCLLRNDRIYFASHSKRSASKSFLNSPYFDYVEENLSDKFIGWPIFLGMGGYDVDNILDKVDPERTQLRISDEDCHPNREGHKIIAQEIYNAYEKNYI